MPSVQAALALTLALPPLAAYCASGSTLPKSTSGVSSVSCTDARLVNWTVWFFESLVGGAAIAEPAVTATATATRPPTSAMRMRDMQHPPEGGKRVAGSGAAGFRRGGEGIVRKAGQFMTRSGEPLGRRPSRIPLYGDGADPFRGVERLRRCDDHSSTDRKRHAHREVGAQSKRSQS